MRFYLAICTGAPHTDGLLLKKAHGTWKGDGGLREQLQEFPNTKWVVTRYDVSMDRETLFRLIEDPIQVDASDEPHEFTVDISGNINQVS